MKLTYTLYTYIRTLIFRPWSETMRIVSSLNLIVLNIEAIEILKFFSTLYFSKHTLHGKCYLSKILSLNLNSVYA